ncbi:EAL domain-containing protein [Massilia sp.]|uniref:putative bifunctional diguanylate cyclase/phosphodiesterase n=1 Tax=Massilia sp. TaxID=1882437 RepID=UPI0028A7AF2B|nr:EAL domain-containing protein [Massilia sp.]
MNIFEQRLGRGHAGAGAAPGATVIADADRRVLGASADFLARTGLAHGDLAGRSLDELGPMLERCRHLAQPAGLHVVPVGAQGGVAYHAATLFEARAAQPGAPPRNFDELLDHIPAGVVICAADSRAIYANRYALELLGVAIDKMRAYPADSGAWQILRADGSVLPPADYPVNCVLRTGAMVGDVVVGLPGPSVRWLLCNAYPVFDAAGQVGEVVVCFTDCTELKQVERSLHKSEERLRLVLQGSTDGSWDWDLVQHQLYYSERWWEMIGYGPHERESDERTWRAFVHPDDLPRVHDYLERLMASTEHSYHIEMRLRHREGHYVPVLARGFVLRDEAGRAVRLSGTNTDLTEAKRAEQRIYELAYFDYLTGLPNRRLLIEQLGKILTRAARTRQHGALLFIDLDNFKLLNDTLGHDIGDHLLRQVAERLRHTVRESDHLSRLGGDEFVVVLENLGESEAAAVHESQLVGGKLLGALAQPYYLAGRPSVSTPSVGVAVFGAGATSVELLLRQADLAMYRAKAEGRNTVRFFDPSMQAAADRQIELENDLRDGIRRGHFELHCQPQFGLDGALAGGEVLVRWRHDVRGLVMPGEFIGLAEGCGLIAPLGKLVLSESCRVLARWARDARLRELTLAVNVSAHQLREADFVDSVLACVRESGADPRRLCLELTETVFAENVEDVSAKMNALRDHGIRFSLDDFGTGYSSLSYLRRFPLAELKVDRGFVKDLPGDAHAGAIVDAILALARTLDLTVVAEGVETGEQRDFLAAHGCQVLQGYLLGRPIPVAEFERRYGG